MYLRTDLSRTSDGGGVRGRGGREKLGLDPAGSPGLLSLASSSGHSRDPLISLID